MSFGRCAVSSRWVALHKEQFGRGPTRARANFAGPDVMVCVLDDILLPAERALVEMGQQERVRESRLFMQVATRARFIAKLESIVRRRVVSFVSASDPDRDVVYEICEFAPVDGSVEGGLRQKRLPSLSCHRRQMPKDSGLWSE